MPARHGLVELCPELPYSLGIQGGAIVAPLGNSSRSSLRSSSGSAALETPSAGAQRRPSRAGRIAVSAAIAPRVVLGHSRSYKIGTFRSFVPDLRPSELSPERTRSSASSSSSISSVDSPPSPPDSDGSRRGVEPLCAWYSQRCLPAVEACLAADDLRVIGFHDAVRVERLPLARVQDFGDPARLFANVNTRDDLAAVDGPRG